MIPFMALEDSLSARGIKSFIGEKGKVIKDNGSRLTCVKRVPGILI